MIRRVLGLLPLLTVLVAVGCSSVKDTRPDPTPLEDFEAEAQLDVLWSEHVGGAFTKRWTSLSPAVADERVFTVNRSGEVTAWEREKGREIWRNNADEFVSAGIGLDAEHVYVGTQGGRVIAFARDGGERVWDRAMEGELLAAPATGEGIVVVRTVDGRVTALDPSDGSREWRFSTSVPELTLRGVGRPVIVDGGVLVGLDDGRVVALEAGTGETFWESTVAESEGRSPIERMVDVDGAIGAGRRMIYAGAYQGRVVEIDPGGGRINWSRDISSYAGLDVDADRVYVTDEQDRVRALAQNDGDELWRQDALAWRGLSAPVPVPGTDWLAVTDRQSFVHLLDREDGAIVARARVDGRWPILADPVVDGDGRIYIQSQGARITVYEPRSRD